MKKLKEKDLQKTSPEQADQVAIMGMDIVDLMKKYNKYGDNSNKLWKKAGKEYLFVVARKLTFYLAGLEDILLEYDQHVKKDPTFKEVRFPKKPNKGELDNAFDLIKNSRDLFSVYCEVADLLLELTEKFFPDGIDVMINLVGDEVVELDGKEVKVADILNGLKSALKRVKEVKQKGPKLRSSKTNSPSTLAIRVEACKNNYESIKPVMTDFRDMLEPEEEYSR